MMAMTPVMDNDLADVTAQAGVNINADIAMNIGIGTMAWGDADGLTSAGGPWTTTASGGYVGVTGFNVTNLRIKARETDTFNGYSAPAMLKPITIDVASDPTYVLHNGATFVRIGLGSLEISMDAMSFNVELGTTTALGEVMGVASVGPMALYINPLSYVDIYNSRPGNRTGVNLTMNIIVDEFSLDYLSWGDADGQDNMGIGVMPWMSTGAQSAGYIGFDNLIVGGPITLTGTVMIDITTSYAGIYSHGVVGTDPGAAPVSVVHIGFPSLFNLNVAGPITANVRLANNPALDNTLAGNAAGTLGDVYLSAFNLDILAGSWVDIWAH